MPGSSFAIQIFASHSAMPCPELRSMIPCNSGGRSLYDSTFIAIMKTWVWNRSLTGKSRPT